MSKIKNIGLDKDDCILIDASGATVLVETTAKGELRRVRIFNDIPGKVLDITAPLSREPHQATNKVSFVVDGKVVEISVK